MLTLLKQARSAAFIGLVSFSLPSLALNIVLTNDDGFETPFIQAVHSALLAAGHDVIMAAPYGARSGSGGAADILEPLEPTSSPSPGGTLPAGSPAIGPTGLGPEQYYVDSTPSTAVLYGTDVLAMAAWGQFPDLVISGPNEGNNTGALTPHSGTLGATVAALNKGIPAMAVSAGRGDPEPQAMLVGEIVAHLVAALDGPNGIGLPQNVGLNVNLLDLPENATLDDIEFAFTRVGQQATIGFRFFERIGESPIANLTGISADDTRPGLSVELDLSRAGYPDDPYPRSEQKLLAENVVTISPIQGSYEARPQVKLNFLKRRLADTEQE